MPVIRLTSQKFPSISIPVPDIPGIGGAGSFEFYMGHEYTVTADTLQAVRRSIQGYPPRVRDHLFLTVRDEQVVEPEPKKTKDDTVATGTGEEELPHKADALLEELSDEDVDLVEVEVAKLRGRTISEAEPMIETVALNEELSRPLRVAYLTKVSETATVQATLRRKAIELLDVIKG